MAAQVNLALLWGLSNYRLGVSARVSFYCDFSRVELLGLKIVQFLFGGVLPRVCGQL